jgi:hypothetical protein
MAGALGSANNSGGDMMKTIAGVVTALLLMSCADMGGAPAVKFKDNEQPVPAGYKGWSKFLSEIQRPDAKQVREIFINPVGGAAQKGQPFANGTILVMENYAAKAGADGTLMKGADGKLVKGDLLRVFVMGKGDGWGDNAPQGLKNGDWVYAAYTADGKMTSPEPIATCRACHLPLVKQDFVHRYDEYFDKR